MKLKWPGKRRRKETKALTDQELYERIQQRAFSLYQGRGATNGSDLDDWLKAEEEIAKELKIKKPSLN